MTAYRFVTLTCDECGEIFDDGESLTASAARAAAATEGWKRDRRGDTCPAENGWTRQGHHGWVRTES